ncbi:MAG: 50S ribosomal protein L6 [bacterium]|nr:50S ribosomal protein L6 [bacterium]MDZ4285211.1 50S ribosomal protein L6 [Patescibacteria group bacterium]
MSRYGKQPITIPVGVDVTLGDGGEITVGGAHGTLARVFRSEIEIRKDDNALLLAPRAKTELAHALWGTYAAHLRNMIQGVREPFVKKLVIEGVGFRAEAAGETLTLQLGFSHPVKVAIPKGIAAKVEKGTITITGADKELVGEFAARVRALKKPEPYKGKGIRYEGEVVRRKQGKKSV